MRLNDLRPDAKSKRAAKRVGRGMSSGDGKTCGRGHKGQLSRTGSGKRPGFEGGQMPLQRRLPKFGFISRTAQFVDEIRLGSLEALAGETIDLATLKKAGLVHNRARRAKVIVKGALSKAVTVKGLKVSKGARAAIEAAGGTIEE